MEKSRGVGDELPRPFVHDLVNKLAVIVGHCELLSDHLEPGSHCAQRVGAIQELAQGMADELNKVEWRRAEWPRSADVKRCSVA